MVACCHLQGKQVEILVDCFYDLVTEGPNKGTLGPEKVVEKVATGAHLLLCGQGSDDDPQYHARRPGNLVCLGVPYFEGCHVRIGSVNVGPHVLCALEACSYGEPPICQAGFLPGFTNRSPNLKLNRPPPHVEDLCVSMEVASSQLHTSK